MAAGVRVRRVASRREQKKDTTRAMAM